MMGDIQLELRHYEVIGVEIITNIMYIDKNFAPNVNKTKKSTRFVDKE